MRTVAACSPVSYRRRHCLWLCVAFQACIGLTFAKMPAPDGETPGTITGHVSNAGTKESLEGAVAPLSPGNLSQMTTPAGEFFFPRVPAGDYSLTVSYTGL